MLSSNTVALIRQSTYFKEENYKKKKNTILNISLKLKKNVKLYMFSTAKSVVHLAKHGSI